MAPLRRLLSLNRVPPGGAWFYTVPETGVQFQDRMSLRGLSLKVAAHYTANNLPVPVGLEASIQDFICKNMPDGVCDGQKEDGVPRLDFFSILGATELLLRRFSTRPSRFFVPVSEAERRAQICLKCPLNLQNICTTCNGLRETFQKLVSNRTTRYDSRLGVCRACGCGLQAKVHIASEFLPPVSDEARSNMPDPCWAKG